MNVINFINNQSVLLNKFLDSNVVLNKSKVLTYNGKFPKFTVYRIKLSNNIIKYITKVMFEYFEQPGTVERTLHNPALSQPRLIEVRDNFPLDLSYNQFFKPNRIGMLDTNMINYLLMYELIVMIQPQNIQFVENNNNMKGSFGIAKIADIKCINMPNKADLIKIVEIYKDSHNTTTQQGTIYINLTKKKIIELFTNSDNKNLGKLKKVQYNMFSNYNNGFTIDVNQNNNKYKVIIPGNNNTQLGIYNTTKASDVNKTKFGNNNNYNSQNKTGTKKFYEK